MLGSLALLFGLIQLVRTSILSAMYEQDFYNWIANNFREITARPLTDPDYFNNIRINSKDGMYHKGKTITKDDIAIIKNAESISIVCDKRYSVPISIPPLLLEIKSVKSIFLKNIVIPSVVSQITKLENVEEIKLHSCNVDDLTCLLPTNSMIKTLILHDCDIKNCYLDKSKTPQLKTLIINNCNLHSINKEAFLIKSLKEIDFKNNQIIDFPVLQSTDNPETEILNLERNRFIYYPKALNFFKKLKKLNLSFNLIEKFEDPFSKDLSLEEFNLEGNIIKKLPKGIENLRNLKKLNLSHNIMEECKTQLFQLPNLEYLDLSFNKFKTIDESISFISRGICEASGVNPGDAPIGLKYLDLSYNFLTDIPISFKYFKNIRILNLDGNNLFNFPDAVLNLKRLSILKLSYNKIQYIPPEIADLPFIIEIYLMGGNDFRKTNGVSNVIVNIPKNILNHRSRKKIKLYLKGNSLQKQSTEFSYGLDEIVQDFSPQVIFN